MALPGSSPRWREVEARLRAPSVRPDLQVVSTVYSPEPEPVIDFAEIKRLRAELAMDKLAAPLDDRLRWTVREIMRLVADKYELTVNDIRSEGRTKRLVNPRQEVCYEAARLTQMSLVQIGNALGGRDHTTVLHAIRAHTARTGLPPVRGIVPRPSKSNPTD